MREISKCLATNHVCTGEDLKEEINRLLFQPPSRARDKEELTIIVPKGKEHHYDFLKAYTKYDVLGSWRNLREKNTAINIQFHDTKEEEVGIAVIELIKQYNAAVVGEEVPYAFTSPIEESTIE
ncbi:hypothetical protein DRQ25_00320 [Candidatus Fermentibacteria bacterium]|nr:MAG: hypothetical protein DRQ25_00320 [Candidatus Fermentibacteria bacterium]